MIEDGTLELHPLALGLLDRMAETPSTALSPAQMKEAQRTAREHLSERWLFISLCIVSARLAEGPLAEAAGQLRDLALIGLSVAEVAERTQAVRRPREHAAFAMAEDRKTLDAIAKQVRALADPTSLMRSLTTARQRRAALAALEKRKADVIISAAPDVREDLISDYAELCTPNDRQRFVRALASGTSAHDDVGLLFLLQFSPVRELRDLVAEALAAGRSREALTELVSGARSRDGRALAELITSPSEARS